jgi:hypothetical protein
MRRLAVPPLREAPPAVAGRRATGPTAPEAAP